MISKTVGSGQLNYLDNYLDIMPPQIMKNNSIASLIIPNMVLILPIYIDPFIPLFKYLLWPPIILLNIWAIVIFLFPYRLQIQSYLFIGCYGLLVSAGLVIASIKIVYYSMGVQSIYYPVVTIAGYLLLLVVLARIHVKSLYAGGYYRANQKPVKMNRQAAIISLFTGAGIVIGQVLVAGKAEYNQTLAVLSGLYLVLAVCMLLMASNLHKYVLMLKHPELIQHKKNEKPAKKRRKK